MHIRHIERMPNGRELAPNLNAVLTEARSFIERTFKELIPETMAGTNERFDYQLMDAFVKEYNVKSYLCPEHNSVVISNYGALEQTILHLATPEVLTVAGDVGSGKTTALRALKYFLEVKNCRVYVLYIHLRLALSVEIGALLSYIRDQLIGAIRGDMTRFLERCNRNNNRPLIEQVFYDELKATGGIDSDGTEISRRLVDETLADLMKNCHDRDFGRYCRSYFAFLNRLDIKPILILDDVDMFDNQQLASALVDRAQGHLAIPLGVPVIISIRHETVMKFRDGARPVHMRYLIRAVDSASVISKRMEQFSEWARSPKLTAGRPLNSDEIEYVERRARQFLKSSIIRKLEKMNPSCEFILDVFRTVLLSPIIRPVDDLNWNKVFNTLMLNTWNYLEPTSFVLNVYDNGLNTVPQGQEYRNALLRIRLMQTIVHEAGNSYHMAAPVSTIIDRMASCGYPFRSDICAALFQFAARRLIITTEPGNTFDVHKVNEIFMHPSLRFYLGELLCDYLYLENVIPVTLVDTWIDMEPYKIVPTLEFGRDEFAIMDTNIYNFMRFLAKCEEQEENACKAESAKVHNVQSLDPLIQIRGAKRLTDQMAEALRSQVHADTSDRELGRLLGNSWRSSSEYPYYRV